MGHIVFNNEYYNSIMKEFGYSPLEFEPISFSLAVMTKEDLQRQWLCHTGGRSFAESLTNKRAVVTTGFGLSGVPHMGTLAQILKAIRLQQAGLPVQIVLGDLDAYNGKNVRFERTRELAKFYRQFILDSGFSCEPPNSLRTQYESLTTLRLAYLIGHYMEDEMFNCAEEDLHQFYSQHGKVDSSMSYRRKLSLNLMIADFLELLEQNSFDAVMVILGIDEHRYVDFGRKVLEKMTEELPVFRGKSYSAMYSSIIRGFHGYPKMSKSFHGSGITVDMPDEQIKCLIENGEEVTPFPETNVLYQLISSVSLYGNEQIKEAYEECSKQSERWKLIKREYAQHLIALCRRWPNIS
ncbi:MAG: hypothetical protein A3I29_01985 [Candidatus Magasanikbacteria bacterium RIFCSPLOWO2_02_FULL_44_11]|uniref:Tryptophan--tRNA ligase n=1 Tax=Candidatus Magasanikbacteria bacterium RIFCSPLOWO2_02_FULL_44_11 TaxID=1798689 RepID=A0A1F6N9X0_9BACT|nr:MAG: hypothetical protein A3I29_01985 [Candidatus Magasanikbacteria bacterium RIFCSPLOWO2_02_FULL_44_11]